MNNRKDVSCMGFFLNIRHEISKLLHHTSTYYDDENEKWHATISFATPLWDVVGGLLAF